jgi:hypothetical protein
VGSSAEVGKEADMDRRRQLLRLAAGLVVFQLLVPDPRAEAATELRLDKDFLAGVVENLPPSPFEKKGQYKGAVHSYRLLAIDPRLRRFLAACQVEGEFRPPVSGPVSEHVSRSDDHTSGLRKFRFEIKAGVYVEAGPDATPRFRVDVEEIKRAELEGIVGLLAKLLGKYFDDMITQIADGRAAILNQKLNAEVAKRGAILKQYGAFCGIDYLPDQVVLHFDLTRFKREGIVGYVFTTAAPGTLPLYRWNDTRTGGHQFTLGPRGPDRPNAVVEGIACYVFEHATAGAVPVYGWHGRFDHLYTLAGDGEGAARRGFRPAGVAFYLLSEPAPDTVPFYRFYDPRKGQHIYTTHPHAEFAK